MMRGALLRMIPWDVWVAAAMAVAVVVIAVFEAVPTFFVIAGLAICVYVTTRAFGDKRD